MHRMRAFDHSCTCRMTRSVYHSPFIFLSRHYVNGAQPKAVYTERWAFASSRVLDPERGRRGRRPVKHVLAICGQLERAMRRPAGLCSAGALVRPTARREHGVDGDRRPGTAVGIWCADKEKREAGNRCMTVCPYVWDIFVCVA
jgi:hypothetical protein